MTRIQKRVLSLLALFVVAGFLAAVQAGAEEKYDEDTYGPAAPIIMTKPVKAVVFLHKRHTMDAGLTCDSCHPGIFEMAAGTAESKDDFNMQSLYAGKYCGACHDGSTAFASNTRCTSCHIGVRGYKKLTAAKDGAGATGSHH